MSRNLLVRIAFAVPAIALTLLVLWLGGWLLAALLALAGVLGTREIYDFARRQGITPIAWLGYGAAALIPFAVFWAKGSEEHWAEPAIFFGAVWLLAVLVAAMIERGPEGRPLAAVAVTVFGCLYASALLAFLVAIRHGAHSEAHPRASAELVALPLVLTWICDTCAMAAGTLIGGPKLAPVLSPNKTVAGAIAGTVGALVAAIAIGVPLFRRSGVQLDVWQLAALGLAVGLVAQVGDIAESLFKREAGVKDSSLLIPGHGGVLDRLDSLYFVVPVTAGLLKLFGVT